MLQWYECKCIIRTSGVTILCHVCRLLWKKFFITFWKMVPMICGALRDLVQCAQFKKREFSWKNYFEPFSLWNILTHGRSSKFFFKILKILLLASLTNQYLYSQRHFQNPLKHLRWSLFLANSSQLKPLLALREKCLYSEFFWSVFSRIRTEYGEMQENTGQKNSQYEHFSCSVGALDVRLGSKYASDSHPKTRLKKTMTNYCWKY